MDNILNLWNWITANKEMVIAGYFALVGLASWIVKLTPTLRDDNALKALIKFMGKYVAVNR